MNLPDQLTVARALSVPLVVLLYAWELPNNEYWATALFCVAMATDWLDGRIARRRGTTSSLGSLLDPIADKVLVLAVLVMLIEDGVWPGLDGRGDRRARAPDLRAAAGGDRARRRDRGTRPRQAEDVGAGGRRGARRLRRGGRVGRDIAWWALLVALVLTWVSGLDYARVAPRMLRGTALRVARH